MRSVQATPTSTKMIDTGSHGLRTCISARFCKARASGEQRSRRQGHVATKVGVDSVNAPGGRNVEFGGSPISMYSRYHYSSVRCATSAESMEKTGYFPDSPSIR